MKLSSTRSAVPSGLVPRRTVPNVETLGYCRESLRDKDWAPICRVLIFVLACFCPQLRLPAASPETEELIRKYQPGTMQEKEGEVKFQPPARVEPSATNEQRLDFGDALRTLDLARSTVRLRDQSELRMKPATRLIIQ